MTLLRWFRRYFAPPRDAARDEGYAAYIAARERSDTRGQHKAAMANRQRLHDVLRKGVKK